MTLPTLPLFAGSDYQPKRDGARLTLQLERVYNVLRSGYWYTLGEIAEQTGDPEASISAQLRHLRKPQFGSHNIEKRYVCNGLYQYRLAI